MSLHVYYWDQDRDPSSIDKAERSLLGTCLLAPYLLDEAALLHGSDFKNLSRGQVFELMREFPRRRFDACLVARELEGRGVQCPSKLGWIAVIAELLDHAVPDDELVKEYVRIIKEAAALRRAGLTEAGIAPSIPFRRAGK